MGNTVRLNITLPSELGKRLKASKNVSRVIAESLAEHFALQEKKQLEAALREGYMARAEQDATLNAEYDHLSGEGLE